MTATIAVFIDDAPIVHTVYGAEKSALHPWRDKRLIMRFRGDSRALDEVIARASLHLDMALEQAVSTAHSAGPMLRERVWPVEDLSYSGRSKVDSRHCSQLPSLPKNHGVAPEVLHRTMRIALEEYKIASLEYAIRHEDGRTHKVLLRITLTFRKWSHYRLLLRT